MKKQLSACPRCGGREFVGGQRVSIEVIVDFNGEFLRNLKLPEAIYDFDDPFGPYACRKCKVKYDHLPIEVEEEKTDDSHVSDITRIVEAILSAKQVEEGVDGIVHDLISARATEINNGGAESQAKFLLSEFGGDTELVLKTIAGQLE